MWTTEVRRRSEYASGRAGLAPSVAGNGTPSFHGARSSGRLVAPLLRPTGSYRRAVRPSTYLAPHKLSPPVTISGGGDPALRSNLGVVSSGSTAQAAQLFWAGRTRDDTVQMAPIAERALLGAMLNVRASSAAAGDGPPAAARPPPPLFCMERRVDKLVFFEPSDSPVTLSGGTGCLVMADVLLLGGPDLTAALFAKYGDAAAGLLGAHTLILPLDPADCPPGYEGQCIQCILALQGSTYVVKAANYPSTADSSVARPLRSSPKAPVDFRVVDADYTGGGPVRSLGELYMSVSGGMPESIFLSNMGGPFGDARTIYFTIVKPTLRVFWWTLRQLPPGPLPLQPHLGEQEAARSGSVPRGGDARHVDVGGDGAAVDRPLLLDGPVAASVHLGGLVERALGHPYCWRAIGGGRLSAAVIGHRAAA